MRQAIWLVSTEEFKRASYQRRQKSAFANTSDPERARRNHMGRDLLLAAHIRRRTEELGLAILEVDGMRLLDEVASLVDAHFAPFLPDIPTAAPAAD